jgi:putative CocE/NonD family hydrolase
VRQPERDELGLASRIIAGCRGCHGVDLWATAQTFQAGHRLRVHVTSSDFPRYDRNLNTGGAFGEETSGQVATNTVFHDEARPSHLLLPVMSAGDVEAALAAYEPA